MKGQYINTVIMMAALAGKKSKKNAAVKEIIAATGDHKIIWSKINPAEKNQPVAYRSVSALIH